ncbi:hypothetical protein BAL199_02064 [alpha proteobacterium BAL199]|jgi:hypothetical protein|nr:hypothetical protein BAL199_02064 [alpha proteobacterium BAL199]
MNPRDLIQLFVESMAQLTAVMRHEIELIRGREFTKLEDVQRRKAQIAKGYHDHQTRLRKNLAALDALSDEERTDLRKLYASFRETLSENMIALKSAHDATDRVVKMVISGVKKARGVTGPDVRPGKPVRGYAAYGTGGVGAAGYNRTL